MQRLLTAKRQNTAIGWLFVLPVLLLLGIFSLGSVGYVAYLSLLKWNLITPNPQFIGFTNYSQLFTDNYFWGAVSRTFLYLIGTTVVILPLSFFLAWLLQDRLRASRFFRGLFFLPYVVPTVASAIAWSWLFDGNHGLINLFLRMFHLPAQPWLSNPNEALFVIMLLYIWQFTGYFVVLYINGLQAVPTHVYESAMIDGATTWQKIWHITLPLITPTTFFILTMSIIFSFLSFDQVYVLTQGGPAQSTTTIIYYLYQEGFQFYDIGRSGATAMVLFIFLIFITFLQFKGESKWVHHQM